MPAKPLRSFIQRVKILEHHGDLDQEILGIAYDSRQAGPGHLFAALEGLHTDGHRYIDQALDQGASAVLHSRLLERYHPKAAYLRVEDTRRALSPLAAAFFGHPSEKLRMVGVTGTDGKSTTVWLLQQLLEALGQPSGFLSTVALKTDSGVVKNPFRQSTPEAPEVQGFLAQMVEAGKRYAVVEATSHGLSSRTSRLADVAFDAAVLTNVTHEHLEFHGTFEQYRSDKANLFRALDIKGAKPLEPRFGVVNLEDPSHDYFGSQTRAPVFTYSIRSPRADLWADDFSHDLRGSWLTLHLKDPAALAEASQRVRLNLPGLFMAENLLAAALAAARLLNLPLAAIGPFIPGLTGVKGRMEEIDLGQPFRVIVDYAHTPEAFSKLFPMVRRTTPGALIAVFGSAGERDLEKRPLQGRVASRFCDLVVLADEDPRGEDGLKILRDIASGCEDRQEGRDLLVIRDRRQAIRRAFCLAKTGDTVLLLGKGHEESILYSDGPRPWDEAEEARASLRQMGYGS